MVHKALESDKGFDSGSFFLDLERRSIEPHCALVNTAPPKPENVRQHRRE